MNLFINSIYSLADTYFVSSLGTNATAAVSVNASLDQLIMMCGSMLAMGANSYIARLLGKNDDKNASMEPHIIMSWSRDALTLTAAVALVPRELTK